MKLMFPLFDKLIANPTRTNLMVLDKIMRVGIPFNAPHGFKILELSQDSVVIKAPNYKLNHNHLGGIHACAMATIGEYAAGMSLLTMFGISKYRLILSELNVKYLYQGRTDLEGTCSPHQINKEAVESGLAAVGKFLQPLETIIRDSNGKEVAIVKTTWQLKPWENVNTKG